ncbi:MAG: DUF835 domain-containing protein [Candidatus Thermoplasmatota archaeon]
MGKKIDVLLIEDSENDAVLIERELKKGGFKPNISRVQTKSEMKKQLKENNWDIVIADYVLPEFSGLEALKTVKKSKKSLPFIVVSGKIGEDTAVEAMKAGAHDYIMKNNLKRLVPAIRRELTDFNIRKERKKVKKDLKESYNELEKTNKKLKEEIYERKKLEREAVEAKKHLQNVFNSAKEIMISIDANNRITFWNKTAEQITGFKKNEVNNRTITKLSLFDNPKEIEDLIKNTHRNKSVGYEDIIIVTKDKAKKILRIKPSEIKTKDRRKDGILFVGEDITKDIEMHGKIISGNSYLIPNSKNDSAIDLFNDLSNSKYNGFFITRSNPEIVESVISKNVDISLLCEEKLGDFKKISNLKNLLEQIDKFTNDNKNPLILLDGIHYLITRFSFEKFLEYLYKINELIIKNKSILLLRIDPSLLDKNKMTIIENELQMLPSQKVEGIILSDKLYNILKHIFQQNERNALVPYKKIMEQFSIAYSTAAKRLEKLEDKGLIFTKKQGKLRTVFISDKGKTLLNKRETA